MAQQFSQDVLDAMRKRAKAVKDRMASGGGDFSRYANTTGKSAIVQPGGSVELRLLPHWAFFAERYVRDPRTKKLMDNPKYFRREACFGALEHWYETPEGKTTRDWCRRNLGDQEPCPGCDSAAALKGGTEEERRLGLRIAAKEVYLYNAILRKTPFGEDGKPAIRILLAPATVYVKVVGLCTGEDSEKFALGDVTDPFEGYDLQITRPAAQGDRYDVKAASKPSRLHEQGDQKWAGWHKALYDLEKDVLDNVPSVEDFEKKIYGAVGAQTPGSAGQEPAAGADTFPGDVGGEEASPLGGGEGEAFEDFDMPGEDEPPPAAAPAAGRPSPPVAPPASRRSAPGRRR